MNSLTFFLLKALLSGALIAAISELAKRNNLVASIVHSLPLVSILALLWLYGDTRDTALIGRHMFGTFWFVLPSLPMFLLVPWLYRRGYTFGPGLLIGLVVTVILYYATLRLLKAADVQL